MPEGKTSRFLIQIERPGEDMDMPSIEKLLEGSGVHLDSSYGPHKVNPRRGLLVVRGWATEEAKKRAERINGVRFFFDGTVAPT